MLGECKFQKGKDERQIQNRIGLCYVHIHVQYNTYPQTHTFIASNYARGHRRLGLTRKKNLGGKGWGAVFFFGFCNIYGAIGGGGLGARAPPRVVHLLKGELREKLGEKKKKQKKPNIFFRPPPCVICIFNIPPPKKNNKKLCL